MAQEGAARHLNEARLKAEERARKVAEEASRLKAEATLRKVGDSRSCEGLNSGLRGGAGAANGGNVNFTAGKGVQMLSTIMASHGAKADMTTAGIKVAHPKGKKETYKAVSSNGALYANFEKDIEGQTYDQFKMLLSSAKAAGVSRARADQLNFAEK